MTTSFVTEVVSALENQVEKNHDDYTEIKYDENFWVHVWSHDNGEGYFEIEVIVPYDAPNYVEGYDSFIDFPGSDEFYKSVEEAVEEAFSPLGFNLTFYHQDTVGENVSERPHDIFYTEVLYYDGEEVTRV